MDKVLSQNPVTGQNGTDRFDFTFLADSVDPIGRVMHQQTTCDSWAHFDSLQVPCGLLGVRSVSNRYDRRSHLVFQLDDTQRDSLHYDASGNMIYRYHWSGFSPGRDSMTMMPGSNRLASDNNLTSNYVVKNTYDADGSRIIDSAFPIVAANAVLFRWQYYDAMGRNSGFRYATNDPNVPGQLDVHSYPTHCGYDPDGAINRACPVSSSWNSTDGPNVSALNDGWRFISAPGVDEPLMGRYALSSNRRTLYFVTDGLGRQLAVGDSLGQIVNLDLNGSDQSQWSFAGTTQNGWTFNANRMGNPDQPGVSYFRNRAYDSRSGRWLQEDPIGVAGGLNLYQFNGNNPVAYTDPFGLCIWDGCIAEFVGLSMAAVAAVRVAANAITRRPLGTNVAHDASMALNITTAIAPFAPAAGRIAGALGAAGAAEATGTYGSTPVASKVEANVAARIWAGIGGRAITSNTGSAATGEVVGRISADATRVARYAEVKTNGSTAANLVNRVVGSNMHVVVEP